jgi:hypothetical protein
MPPKQAKLDPETKAQRRREASARYRAKYGSYIYWIRLTHFAQESSSSRLCTGTYGPVSTPEKRSKSTLTQNEYLRLRSQVVDNDTKEARHAQKLQVAAAYRERCVFLMTIPMPKA